MNGKYEEVQVQIKAETFSKVLHEAGLPDILSLEKRVSREEFQRIDKDVMTAALLTMLAAQVGPEAAASGEIETTVQPDGGALVQFRVVAMSPGDLLKLLRSVFQQGVEQGVMAGSEAVAAAVNKSGGNIRLRGVKKGPASDPVVEITR